jgi:hypothetical protein
MWDCDTFRASEEHTHVHRTKKLETISESHQYDNEKEVFVYDFKMQIYKTIYR